MATPDRVRWLDIEADTPEEARAAIKLLLSEEPTATRKVYAALVHKVWTLLVDRRLDDEVRDWHALVNRVKTHIRAQDAAASEWLVPLSDLLRESIGFAETSPARDVAKRPNARRLLETLLGAPAFVSRQSLLETLGLGSSHLSNILTQLQLHNLIERRGNGKQAEFRLTAFGRAIASNAAAPAVRRELETQAPASQIFDKTQALDEQMERINKTVQEWNERFAYLKADNQDGAEEVPPINRLTIAVGKRNRPADRSPALTPIRPVPRHDALAV